MKHIGIIAFVAATAVAALPRPGSTRSTPQSVADTVISLERAALDRWGRGDPQGYVETYAPEITYFDPYRARRIDGIDSMQAILKPITGMVKIERYEMLNPKVQRSGDIAVLSFNLISHTRNPDGSPREVRWNSTEVYRRAAGRWKIVHSHWSFTQPALKPGG